MLALDMLELDKIEPNHELTDVQSMSVLCHAITALELYHPQVLHKNKTYDERFVEIKRFEFECLLKTASWVCFLVV